MRENETKYNAADFDGGIAPAANPQSAITAKLQTNTDLMRRFGAPGTPALTWRDKEGKVLFRVGVPRLSELPEITGLLEQHIDDPELADFR